MNEEFFRFCPSCNDKIIYIPKSDSKKDLNSLRQNIKRLIKTNKTCRKCFKANFSIQMSGTGNHFSGKKHTEEYKINSSFKRKGIPLSEERRTNLLEIGKQNFLNGKMVQGNVYDFWFNKFGKEIADKKLLSLKEKQSKNSSGAKNPMYGKPSPQGSGNGWSGWYKNWFFRSLRELSYVINVIEKNNHVWQTVENKQYQISYTDWDGKQRNYFADFLINDSILVECKPKKLWNTPKILAKKEFAEKFCLDRGWMYVLVDPPLLSSEEILLLYKNEKIKFTEKYEIKFKEKYLNANM